MTEHRDLKLLEVSNDAGAQEDRGGGGDREVGCHVVEVLKAQGHDVVAMSRASGVDIITGDGLAEVLTGVDCVIDTAPGRPTSRRPPEFFTTVARNLHAAEKAGV